MDWRFHILTLVRPHEEPACGKFDLFRVSA
jgi:hypothetical protein